MLDYSPREAKLVDIEIRKIQYKDKRTQMRCELNQPHVDRLAKAIEDGEDLDAIILYYDGEKFWVVDGFHRIHAHLKLKLKKIKAWVYLGSMREAILSSCSSNSEHRQVLPRSNRDKHRAIATLIEDPEWGTWSTLAIARACQVRHETVSKLRDKLGKKPAVIKYLDHHQGAVVEKRAASHTRPTGAACVSYDRPEGRRTCYTPIALDILELSVKQLDDLGAKLAKDDIDRARNLASILFTKIYRTDKNAIQKLLKFINSYLKKARRNEW